MAHEYKDWEQAANAKNVSVDELLESSGVETADLPWGGFDAWVAWTFLDRFRSYGEFGPHPIKFSDIISYMHLRGIPNEYGIILLKMLAVIEEVYMASVAKYYKSGRS